LKEKKGAPINDSKIATFKNFANHSKMKKAALTAISV
jgi:calcium-dependent protein kinase